MIIKTLILTSFGKFKNRTIEIGNQFNLIYGVNEAGKSTVQHFIEGMFFGFYKPYRKKRSYSSNFERFRPRHSEQYCGSIIYEDDQGRVIRVERDFLKKQDGVKIYDEITGNDITEEFPYDSVTRQHLPLGNMKINAVMYNNTVNIKQMAGASDAELAKEVNDRLLELNSGGREDVSISRVKEDLIKRRDSIGSVAKSRSPLGEAARELAALESGIVENSEVAETIRKNQERMIHYKKRIKLAEEKYETYSKMRQEKTRQELDAMRGKVSEIEVESIRLKKQLEEYEKYKDYDTRTYNRLKVLQSNSEGAMERMIALRQEKDGIDEKRTVIQTKVKEIGESLKNLSRGEIRMDYQKFQFLQDNNEEPIERVKPKKADAGEAWIDLSRIPQIALFIIAFIGVGFFMGAFMNPGSLLPRAAIFVLAFIGWMMVLGAGALLYIKNKNFAAPYLAEEEEAPPKESYEPISGTEAILQKYGKKSAQELEIFVSKAEDLFGYMDKLGAEEAVLTERMEKVELECSRLSQDKENFDKELIDALQRIGEENLESYNEGCEKRRNYEQIKSELLANERLYEELSGGDLIRVDPDDKQTTDDPVIFITDGGEKIRAREALIAFNQEVARLQGENALLSSRIGSNTEVQEKIECLRQKIADYEEDQSAYDKAIQVFETIARDTHRGAAPEINEKIGQVLEMITHKYSAVRVDDKLQVKIIDPENGNLLDLSQLSGGTIDQIYFALRFSVGDALEINENMPFILDDPFVQYDAKRKTEVVKFLCNICEGRQVLLFTCSGDEKNILASEGLVYNGIIL